MTDETPQFVFLFSRERFVTRSGARWNLDEPMTMFGIRPWLLEKGLVPEMEDAHRIIKKGFYTKCQRTDVIPNADAIATDENGDKILNTWVPPTLRPMAGTYPRIERILDWATGHDPKGVQWFKHWLAFKVQNPASVPKIAVVLTGEPGSGKNTIALIIQEMLGRENTATIQRRALENKFNARWIDKLFVFADEVMQADNVVDVSDHLKILIDGEETEIEGKGTNQRKQKNRLAWLFASNNMIAPVVVEKGDRRYTVFSNHAPITAEYKSMLQECFDPSTKGPTESFQAEMAALYAELLDLPVDLELISRPYSNQARENLIEASKAGHELWCEQVEADGVDGLLADVIRQDFQLERTRPEWDFGEEGVSTQILFKSYVHFCRANGYRSLKQGKFGSVLKHRWSFRQNRISGTDRRVNCYVVTRGNPSVIPFKKIGGK